MAIVETTVPPIYNNPPCTHVLVIKKQNATVNVKHKNRIDLNVSMISSLFHVALCDIQLELNLFQVLLVALLRL